RCARHARRVDGEPDGGPDRQPGADADGRLMPKGVKGDLSLRLARGPIEKAPASPSGRRLCVRTCHEKRPFDPKTRWSTLGVTSGSKGLLKCPRSWVPPGPGVHSLPGSP